VRTCGEQLNSAWSADVISFNRRKFVYTPDDVGLRHFLDRGGFNMAVLPSPPPRRGHQREIGGGEMKVADRDIGRTRQHHRVRRVACAVGLMMGVFSLPLLTVTPATAALPPPTQFTYTGGEQSYVVPSGVTLVTVNAIGAAGGPGPIGAGGVGETVTGYLPVTPGKTLYTEVGQTGSAGGGGSFGGGGAAGTQSGGVANAASGGGASDVQTCSETAPTCPGGATSSASRLIVAGGGGGGGGTASSEEDVCDVGSGAGGANGSGIVSTHRGSFILGNHNGDIAPSIPAGGGTNTAPGGGGQPGNCTLGVRTWGGSTPGVAGNGPLGGSGGNATGIAGGGGGGGGGYFGGGSGGSGQICTSVSPGCASSDADGSGGAGGSSFVSPKALIASSTFIGGAVAPPSVTYTPEMQISSPANGATYVQGTQVDASFTCDASLLIGCTGTVATGLPFNTSTVGSHTFVVRSMISANGTHTVKGTVTYTVTKRTTVANVRCTPSPVAAGQSTTCTAQVADTAAGTPAVPTGTVRMSSTIASGLPSQACTLATINPSTAGCSVVYEPSAIGSFRIVAAYAGDGLHKTSSGHATLKVT